jgi:hypothetical protein
MAEASPAPRTLGERIGALPLGRFLSLGRYLPLVVFLGATVVLVVLAVILDRDPAPSGASPAFASPARVAPGRGNVTFVRLLRRAPDIIAGTPPPHGQRGPCTGCHRIRPASPTGNAAVAAALGTPSCVRSGGGMQVAGTQPQPAAPGGSAPTLAMLPFQEAHWQGLELIIFTPALARVLKLPAEARGVLVDEVTMPADVEGFRAGDLITAIDGLSTPDLDTFVEVAYTVRDRTKVDLQVLREGQRLNVTLAALRRELGTANGETAPMIPTGSRPPHNYLGACTSCHRIGGAGEAAVDLGDTLTKKAPPIQAGQQRPHRDRGACSACHVIR